MLNKSFREDYQEEIKGICSECECELYEGDRVYSYQGTRLCKDCMFEIIEDEFGEYV